MKNINILSLKSFGDCIIPITCFSSSDLKINLFIGEHLVPMVCALNIGSNISITVLKTGGKVVPALFNVRKSNFSSILKSFFLIKSEIIDIKNNPKIYVDKLSVRELCLLGFKGKILPRAKNIYSRYLKLAKLPPSILLNSPMEKYSPKKREIAYFPNTSMLEKNLTNEITKTVVRICRSQGWTLVYYRFPSERAILVDGLETRVIVQSFENLIDVMKKHSKAICADSFPMHLREFFKLKTFLVKNFDNRGWTPLSILCSEDFIISKNPWNIEEKLVNYLN